jgi:hypothetical protein
MHSPRSRIDDRLSRPSHFRPQRARYDRQIDALADILEKSGDVTWQADEDLAEVTRQTQGVATLNSAAWLAKAHRDSRRARLRRAAGRILFLAVFGTVLLAV